MIFFLVMSGGCANAQDASIRFYSFAHFPEKPNDSLYQILKNTSSTDKKLQVLFELAEIHEQYAIPDSLLFYGNLLKETVLTEKNDVSNQRFYELSAYGFIANAQLMNGLFDEALKTNIEALSLADAESIEDKEALMRLKFGLGRVYLAKNELETAAELFDECLEFSGSDIFLAKANIAMGDVALKNEDIDGAVYYYDRAQENLGNTENLKFKYTLALNQALISIEQKYYDKALGTLEDIMKSTLENGFYDLYTEAVSIYGSVCTELGRYQVAEIALASAYANSIQWNRLELQKTIIEQLRRTYAAKGDYENAYALMTQYLAVSNEIIEKQNSTAIKELEVKYQTLQKENEIFALKEEQLKKEVEISRQKTIKTAFLIGFLVLLIPIISLLVVYYQKLQAQSQLNIQQEEINTQKIGALLNEQELKLVRTSLEVQQKERGRIARELHDSIGGNLAGIKLQLANLDNDNRLPQNIMKQVDETYNLVRDISHDLIPKKFDENTFCSLIGEYLSKFDSTSTLNISFNPHPKDAVNKLPNHLKVEIYRILQELMTNTLKHSGANLVEIHLMAHKNQLQLLFEDDGVGFDKNKIHEGIGLGNIMERIKKINGSMNIDTTINRGTAVTIEIPISHNENHEA